MKIYLLQRLIGGPTGAYSASVRTFSTKESAEDFQKQMTHELRQLLADHVMRRTGGKLEPLMTVNDCLGSLGVTQLSHSISEFEVHESGLVLPATKLIMPS